MWAVEDIPENAELFIHYGRHYDPHRSYETQNYEPKTVEALGDLAEDPNEVMRGIPLHLFAPCKRRRRRRPSAEVVELHRA